MSLIVSIVEMTKDLMKRKKERNCKYGRLTTVRVEPQ